MCKLVSSTFEMSTECDHFSPPPPVSPEWRHQDLSSLDFSNSLLTDLLAPTLTPNSPLSTQNPEWSFQNIRPATHLLKDPPIERLPITIRMIMQTLLWSHKCTVLWPCLSLHPLFELVFPLILCSSATLASLFSLEQVRFFPVSALAVCSAQKALPPDFLLLTSIRTSPLQRGLSWPSREPPRCPATL